MLSPVFEHDEYGENDMEDDYRNFDTYQRHNQTISLLLLVRR
jgi:hypothetical protein